MESGDIDRFYRATTFYVYPPGGPSIPIRIGRLHQLLDQIIAPARSWAFITAYNPRSVVLSASENASRLDALARTVEHRCLTSWPGEGISDDTDWTPEKSLLVLDMALSDAMTLSEQFEQNAFVYGETGQPAELIWTSVYDPKTQPN